jgi:hypothetical protein
LVWADCTDAGATAPSSRSKRFCYLGNGPRSQSLNSCRRLCSKIHQRQRFAIEDPSRRFRNTPTTARTGISCELIKRILVFVDRIGDTFRRTCENVSLRLGANHSVRYINVSKTKPGELANPGKSEKGPSTKLVSVGSTSRCNTGVKSLRWGFKCQSLTRLFVERTSHFVEISLRMNLSRSPSGSSASADDWCFHWNRIATDFADRRSKRRCWLLLS